MDVTGPGRLLAGRYRLIAVIGEGGMGVVWRGHDELLDRDVAVKEITWGPHLTEQEQQLARLRATREAQMAGRLSHRNVVRVYDVVEDDGHPCIVMEYLPYKSLRDILREQGQLPPAQAAEIGLGVLAALSAAHEEGILHRDVKPANIMVGPDGRVVLTDFGIARAVDSPTLTADGTLLGSPSYIAPERARGGLAGAGPAADLWGLGASLYTAVEGRPPFERNGALATLTAVVADEPEAAPHAGALQPAISGLLRKDPEQRLSAAEAEGLLRLAAQPAAEPAEPSESPESAATRLAVPVPWRSAAAPPRVSRGLLLALAVLAVAAAGAVGLAFALTSGPGGRPCRRRGTGPRHPAARTPSRPAAARLQQPGPRRPQRRPRYGRHSRPLPPRERLTPLDTARCQPGTTGSRTPPASRSACQTAGRSLIRAITCTSPTRPTATSSC